MGRVIDVRVGTEHDEPFDRYTWHIVDVRLELRDYIDYKDIVSQSIDALRELIKKMEEGE
jgi:hypothetical protein